MILDKANAVSKDELTNIAQGMTGVLGNSLRLSYDASRLEVSIHLPVILLTMQGVL